MFNIYVLPIFMVKDGQILHLFLSTPQRPAAEGLKGRPARAGLAHLCVEAIDAGRGHVLLRWPEVWGSK